MERPTSRPENPMTIAAFLSKAEQHFITDSAPCGRDEKIVGCSYKAKCFIGFILTEEDAAKLDMDGGSLANVLTTPDLMCIIRKYVHMGRVEMAILLMGQFHHDEKWGKEIDMDARRKTFALLRSMLA